MKTFLRLSSLALLLAHSAAVADTMTQEAERTAVSAVARELKDPSSPLSAARAKIGSDFEPLESPRAIELSRLVSRTQYDSTVLVAQRYATLFAGGDQTDTLTVEVTVQFEQDADSGKIQGTRVNVKNATIATRSEVAQ
jgi:hypothetical protein